MNSGHALVYHSTYQHNATIGNKIQYQNIPNECIPTTIYKTH